MCTCIPVEIQVFDKPLTSYVHHSEPTRVPVSHCRLAAAAAAEILALGEIQQWGAAGLIF